MHWSHWGLPMSPYLLLRCSLPFLMLFSKVPHKIFHWWTFLVQSFSHHVAPKQAKNMLNGGQNRPKTAIMGNHGESSKFETNFFLLKPIQIQRKTIKTMQTTLLLPYFDQKIAHCVAKCWGKRSKSALPGPFLGSIVQSSVEEKYFFGFLCL